MGKWVLRGVGVVALVLTGAGAWFTTSWGEIRVVDAAAGGTSPSTSGFAPSSTATTATTATTTSSSSTTATTTAIPTCRPGDELTAGNPTTDWATIVVDNQYRLRPDYAPPDLVDASAAGFSERNGGSDRVREIMIPDLRALREAAERNRTPFVLVSGYRSYERQVDLYEEAVAEEGDHAGMTTARAGHSEHQLGTAIDVLDPQSAELHAGFADTPTGRWLAQNAHRYGFVVSYPDVPVERSCYGFEPWHLRYVGRDVAQQIAESDLTPREWMLSHR